MSLGKAMSFVKTFTREHEFRKYCHKNSLEELAKEFGFSEFELEDAINMALVKCQTEEEAEYYLQLRMYLKLM